jgi:hypothetical protein
MLCPIIHYAMMRVAMPATGRAAPSKKQMAETNMMLIPVLLVAAWSLLAVLLWVAPCQPLL